MSTDSVDPRTLAGDSFAAERDDDTVEAHYSGLERLEALEILKAPHGCMNGLVFIGHMVEDEETGEEAEVFESVPCRRCAAAVEVVEE